MSIQVSSEVRIEDLWKIIRSTDPREAVGKVIQQLHKDLAKIQEQMAKAKQEERQKLRLVENKIQEALRILQANENPELALDLLREIKNLDPQTYALIKPELDRLQQAADNLRHLRQQTVLHSSNGVMV